jgi:hypothetical protein
MPTFVATIAAGGNKVADGISYITNLTGQGIHDDSDGTVSDSNSVQNSLGTAITNSGWLAWNPAIPSLMKGGFFDWQVGTAGWTLAEYANGQHDDVINAFISMVNTVTYPVYIRLFWEMNGNQGGGWASNPSDFIAAWRYIWTKFKNAGVTNVIWDWNPGTDNPAGNPPGWSTAAAFYPGDQYVDWIGIDIYKDIDPVGTVPDYAPQFDTIYNIAVAHSKPVVVNEWGSNSWFIDGNHVDTTDADRATWTSQMFDIFEARPLVRHIIYEYYDLDHEWFNPTDNPLMTAAYRQRIYKLDSDGTPHYVY